MSQPGLDELKDGSAAAGCCLCRGAVWVSAWKPTVLCVHPALRRTLEAKGSLEPIRAKIRAEIFLALDDPVRCVACARILFVPNNTCCG